ncbi:MAG: glycosyltransferase [Desulfobacterium sp.]|nr:glycosyltransferase [Desulfobacterium sp.]
MNRKKNNKISIITPCFNAEKFIAETIQSVISNTAVANKEIELEYIICDGKSSDNTVEIVEKIFSTIRQDNISTEIISEFDSGMYEALSKGLRKVSGDVTAYINAGDFYSPHAFEIVFEIMNGYPIKWLTGLIVRYNEKSHLIDATLPYRYQTNFIQNGYYNPKFLPFIQQESTFWNSGMNTLIDYSNLTCFKYAGDFHLWKQFSEEATLYIVDAWLGGYKIHKGQLSEDMNSYYKEMKQIVSTGKLFEHISAYPEK